MGFGGSEGPITIMFTDMERSTDLAISVGNDAAQAIVRTHNELVRQQMQSHGGVELRSLGDGFKVAFTSVKKAVECAIAVQRAVAQNSEQGNQGAFAIRIGINTGEAIEEEGDLFGTAVNAAARIAAKARGGEILVPEVVRQLASGSLPDSVFVDRGRFRLKGFPERWKLYEVVWQESRRVPTFSERTAFVGRESQLSEARPLLDSARAGRGCIVLISGEAGVGKSRLAQQISSEAEALGFLPLTGRCYEMEGAPPYLPFIEALEQTRTTVSPETFRTALGEQAGEVARIMPELRRWYDDIPPPLDVPDALHERWFVFNSVKDFIMRASSMRPLLLNLEDLHWADESSLLLLQHIAGNIAEMNIVIIGTYRDVGLEVDRPLARTLEDLLRGRLAHRIPLKRLPTAGVEAMLSAISGKPVPPALAKVIFDETDGNPFFVEEVFRHLAEEGRLFDDKGHWRSDLQIEEVDVPESVRLVVGRRLERMGETGRRVLTSAAILGRDFDFRLLEELVQVEEDHLLEVIDAAERADLLVQAGGVALRFTFAHELIRHTLLGSLSLPHRQKLHVRAADALERLYIDEVDGHVADLAHHLFQAGAAADSARTVGYLKRAAEMAMEAAGFEDALRFYMTAISTIDESDAEGRADLLYRIGLAQRSLGDAEAALKTWREALETYERLGATQTAARLCREASFQLLWTGRVVEGSEMAMRGLAALGDTDNEDKAYLLAITGTIMAMGGFFDQAEAVSDQATTLARQMEDPKLEGIAFSARCLNHFFHQQPVKALEAGMEALRLLAKDGSEWDRAQIDGFVQWSLMFLGRIDEAETMAQNIEPLATRLGHPGALLILARTRAITAFMRNPDITALEGFAHRDLELATGRIGWVSDPYTWMGLCHFYRGDWTRASAMFARGASHEPPGAESGRNWSMSFLQIAYSSDAHKARAMYEEHKQAVPTQGSVGTRGEWMRLYAFAEGWAQLGEHTLAAATYPLIVQAIASGTVGRIFDYRLLQTLAGIASSSAGLFRESEEHFDEAIGLCRSLPHLLETFEVWRFRAAMLIRRDGTGDRAMAAELLADAIDGYSAIGMPRHVDMAKDLLRLT